MCCGPWGHKELDVTKQLNQTELNIFLEYTFLNMGSGFFCEVVVLGKVKFV